MVAKEHKKDVLQLKDANAQSESKTGLKSTWYSNNHELNRISKFNRILNKSVGALTVKKSEQKPVSVKPGNSRYGATGDSVQDEIKETIIPQIRSCENQQLKKNESIGIKLCKVRPAVKDHTENLDEGFTSDVSSTGGQLNTSSEIRSASSVKKTKLTRDALAQLQYMICEKELESLPCNHPFCQSLKCARMPLNEFRILLLFDLEMIPEESSGEMVNLRNGCYWKKVYENIIPNWKVQSGFEEQPVKNECEPFPIYQLLIGKLRSVPSDFSNVRTARSINKSILLPHTFLAQRPNSHIFDEEINALELLENTSSMLLADQEEGLTLCTSANRKKSNCLLKRDQYHKE